MVEAAFKSFGRGGQRVGVLDGGVIAGGTGGGHGLNGSLSGEFEGGEAVMEGLESAGHAGQVRLSRSE